MAERDELWQVIYNADEPLPCPRYARRQCAGWDVSAECEVDAIYEAVIKHLTESGRLLPPGGEVSTQWAVRWHLVGGGTDEQDCYRNARETAEQRARRLAANPPMGAVRGEALKRVKYIGPWSPVVSDSSEVPDVS